MSKIKVSDSHHDEIIAYPGTAMPQGEKPWPRFNQAKPRIDFQQLAAAHRASRRLY